MDLSLIKSKLQKFTQPKQPREKVDYSKSYFKPKPGEYQIRIVPSKFDKNYPYREVYFHYGFTKYPILALTNWGKQDPIVELVSQLKKTKDPENWKLAKKMEPKQRVFVPVVVRGQESEGVRLWEFGKEIYTQLLELANDADYGDYTDIVEGRDFTIKVIQDKFGERTVNKVSSVRIKPKPSPLSEDAELVKKLLEEQPDILSLYKENTYEDLKNIVQKWLTPEDEKEETGPSLPTEEDEEDETNDLPFEVEGVEPKVSNSTKFDKLFNDK